MGKTMKLFEIFRKNKKKICLIIQCRLSSTRLPGKALLPLGINESGQMVVLEWVLRAMKSVKCNQYVLATDESSYDELLPYAKKWGYDIYKGPREDVLARFCGVIKETECDLIVRATADNPFLFYEAAQAQLDEYIKNESTCHADYYTWTGLPHGCGVEIIDARSLLKAAAETDSPYDHEHVGPALYNHKEKFNCVFTPAPNRWNYPELRTTIDTAFDYNRSLTLVHEISQGRKTTGPYTTEQILQGMWQPSVRNPVLYIPCTFKGHGTGHLRRCLELACKNHSFVYIPDESTLSQIKQLVEEYKNKGLNSYQIVSSLTDIDSYSLVVTDLFNTSDEMAKLFDKVKTVCALDEGRQDTNYADYTLDIIPSIVKSKKINMIEPGFMPAPQKVRSEHQTAIHTALVTIGGEDPAGYAMPCAVALAQNNVYTTVIISQPEQFMLSIPEELKKYIKATGPVENLKERLYEYDLVVTHYGFTAFEARSAGCAVILTATTEYHSKLAENYSFVCIGLVEANKAKFASLLEDSDKLYAREESIQSKDLSEYIKILAEGKSIECPVCHKHNGAKNPVISRTMDRTYRKCRTCGITYLSFGAKEQLSQYKREYFFEDYRAKYGKTYLEDFQNIKSQGVRRISNIDYIYRRGHSSVTPSILDIGCAMGPFLDAANDSGWQVFGTDICEDAVEYVQNQLHFPACTSRFPLLDPESQFGLQKFDAVTMWYVIEHFEDLDSVLKKVSELVKKGGIFAFSTPSGSGVSALYNKDFYSNSPKDHFTIWEPKKADAILRRYGFKTVKIVSTGHHPERFPGMENVSNKSLKFKIVRHKSKARGLGDTFELYCRKIK